MAAESSTQPSYHLRALDRALFDYAKRWAQAALVARLIAFGMGAAAVLFNLAPGAAPFVTTFISVAAEILSWQGSRAKDRAEALLRKLDWRDTFGWALSSAEISDLLVSTPRHLKGAAYSAEPEEDYFASREAPGPRKAIESVLETAWFSKHIAERTGLVYLAVTAVTALLSVVILVVSIETISNHDVLANIGRVVTSAVTLLFSLGLIRSVVGYRVFSQKAAATEAEAERLRGDAAVDLVQAIKLLYEYQLARATAPLLPTWVWRWMRDDLNEAWRTCRRDAVS